MNVPLDRVHGLYAVILGVLIGCDAAGEDAACPPLAGPHEAAYVSFETGTTWRYDYAEPRAFQGNATSESRTGELTWTLDRVSCASGVTQLSLVEVFDGVDRVVRFDNTVLSEQDRAWTKPVTIRLGGAQLTIPGYTNRLPELQWSYPATEPDTVVVRRLHTAGFGTMDETIAWLARSEGLVFWYDGQSGRVTNSRSL
ncbi:MAG: hypothetical protein R3247_14280, partial [Rhodothermales bacterium]|nr:hypothetical protein [Rhodothermales bacterium]